LPLRAGVTGRPPSASNRSAECAASKSAERAERRSGELLAAMERSSKADAGAARHDVGRADSEYASALARTGVTRQTAHRWQQLAAVPAQDAQDGAGEAIGG
jgi:hypothetical protein